LDDQYALLSVTLPAPDTACVPTSRLPLVAWSRSVLLLLAKQPPFFFTQVVQVLTPLPIPLW
jgi:hypothetical protein